MTKVLQDLELPKDRVVNRTTIYRKPSTSLCIGEPFLVVVPIHPLQLIAQSLKVKTLSVIHEIEGVQDDIGIQTIRNDVKEVIDIFVDETALDGYQPQPAKK
jgi:hypothetical protein